MVQGISGRSVIVTGAAHGVGLAAARRLMRAGAAVMMADIAEDKLEAEAETMREAGYEGQVHTFHGDLTEKLAMTNLMAATLDAYDGIDVLVNAARCLKASEPLSADGDNLERSLAQNVTANLRLSQIVARRMIELGETEEDGPADRAIINVSSVFAQRALPELLGYSVSCAALEQLTRILALALSERAIRVNAIAIGGTPGGSLAKALSEIEDLPEALQEVTPLGRIGDPADAAEAILFLATPGASFITGQVLAVDGGRGLLDPLEGAAL